MKVLSSFLKEKGFYILLSGVVFILLVYKTSVMSMTHDESASFFYLNDKNVFLDLFDSTAWPNANNHWLNTILFQISTDIFGPSEWAIRLPNLLSFLLYAYFLYQLCKEIQKPSLQLLCFSFGIANAYLIDFFATARGYGLGLSFTLMGIYFFFKFLKNTENHKFILLASFGMMLSTLALFSNFLLYLSTAAAVVLLLLGDKNKAVGDLKNQLLLIVLPILLTMFLVYTPLRALSGNEEFKWGVDSLAESFSSLFVNFAYGKWYFTDGHFIAGLIAGLIVPKLVYQMYSFDKEKISSKSFTSFIISLCVIFTFGMLLSKLLFGTLYPVDRKTIIYIPLLSLLIAVLYDSDKKQVLKYFLSLFFSIFIVGHFLFSFKSQSTREWWYDENTRDFVKMIVNDGDKNMTKSVGCHWFFYHTINHYSKSAHGNKIMLHPYNKNIDSEGNYDYFVCFDTDFSLLQSKYSILHRDISGRVILKRK